MLDFEKMAKLSEETEQIICKWEEFLPHTAATSTEDEIGRLIWNLTRAWADLDLAVHEQLDD